MCYHYYQVFSIPLVGFTCWHRTQPATLHLQYKIQKRNDTFLKKKGDDPFFLKSPKRKHSTGEQEKRCYTFRPERKVLKFDSSEDKSDTKMNRYNVHFQCTNSYMCTFMLPYFFWSTTFMVLCIHTLLARNKSN